MTPQRSALDGPEIDVGVDILSQVSLQMFEATPPKIGPFGASTLKWSVDGPHAGFFVELNGRRVPRGGELIVTPTNDQTFTLRARAGRVAEVLGRVTVEVNLTECQTAVVFDIGRIVLNALQAQIDNDAQLYFRPAPLPFGQPPQPPGPLLEFQPDRISFTLLLKVRVENAPDPSVDIEASFGLDVQNGSIVAINEDISVDVSVPPYAWLVPGALIALPIAISNGKQKARNKTRQGIQGIAQLLNAISFPGKGRRLHSVQIELAEGGLADLQLTHCPDDLLQGLLPQVVAPTN